MCVLLHTRVYVYVCTYIFLSLVLSAFLSRARASAFSLISGEKQCSKISVECMANTGMLDKVHLVVTSPLTLCSQSYHISSIIQQPNMKGTCVCVCVCVCYEGFQVV